MLYSVYSAIPMNSSHVSNLYGENVGRMLRLIRGKHQRKDLRLSAGSVIRHFTNLPQHLRARYVRSNGVQCGKYCVFEKTVHL